MPRISSNFDRFPQKDNTGRRIFQPNTVATGLSKIWRLGHSPNARVLPEGI